MSNFNFVQATPCTGASSEAFVSANTAGNCIIVFTFIGADTGVTDTNHNVYALIQTNTAGNVYAAFNIASGPNVVTASPGGGALIALEYSSGVSGYRVCPGCSNNTITDSGTITNIIYPGTSIFTSSMEVMGIFAAWQNGSVGGFSLPGAAMRYNGTIPQNGGTVAGVGDFVVSSMPGPYSNSPLVASNGANPSRSWGVFLNLTGNCPGAAFTISCGDPPSGILGSPYNHLFPVSGGTMPFTFSISSGSLPPGLTLNTLTGAVTGTPTAVGPYAFTIQVTDSSVPPNTISVSCSISIKSPSPWVIQEVSGEIIPTFVQLGFNGGHFRYTVRCINVSQIGSYLDFWEGLGGGSGSISSGGSSGVFPPEAPPTLPNTGYNTYTQAWTSQNSVVVTHNLGTTNIMFQIFDLTSGSPALEVTAQEAVVTDANTLTLTFGGSPAMTGYVVVLAL